MAPKYQALKGMEDILPGEIEKWQWLEEKAHVFLEAQGYKEIRTPALESLELFTRSLGEGSDMVHKEMYAFERGDHRIALRPEMTASVARAVIENHLLKKTKSLRLYYLGSMFRGERPQAGRKRQFHQIGIERINAPGAKADGEVISILWRFLKYLGLEVAPLRLNHLGCQKDRPKLLASLKTYFSGQKEKLCEDCHYRLEKNVLRIFDCKNSSCQPVIQKAPWEDFCTDCRSNFEEVQKILKKDEGIPFKIEKGLVRGIDYYTGVVFEVAGSGLGAQDALAGGGRYDGLYESLGGGAVPASGFSIGIERLLTVLQKTKKDFEKDIASRRIYFASLVQEKVFRDKVQEYLLSLREAGFAVETNPDQTSLSDHLKKANQLGIRHVVICGEDELKKNKLALKDLEERTQKEVDIVGLIDYVRHILR